MTYHAQVNWLKLENIADDRIDNSVPPIETIVCTSMADTRLKDAVRLVYILLKDYHLTIYKGKPI